MTLFEYLSVAISIVLSLSVAQILVNLRAVLAAGIAMLWLRPGAGRDLVQ